MFRFLETLVDPFERYSRAAPPGRYWPFMMWVLRPLRGIAGVVAVVGVLVAFVETALIYYAGRIVDILAETGGGAAALWSERGLELALVALFILMIRPLGIALHMGLVNHSISVNALTVTRWRTHRHVLGQSVGFFQNDFAGRIANRIMQTGPAVEETAYTALEAILYCSAYVLGAMLVLGQADPRLTIPLVLWLAIYIGLLVVLIPPIGRAAERASAARSALTGRIVDAYTNIETVKLFAHADAEERLARHAILEERRAFSSQLRLITIMSFGLALSGGVLIVSVVGTAVWLWSAGAASVGAVAAAAALTLRLNSMTGWIMWMTSQLFQHAGVIREGLETISRPHAVVDAPGAKPLEVTGGGIRFIGVRHRYGKAAGGLEGVDLDIVPGERVGLVGHSGAGKSTLVNLLLRFHDVEEGRIEIDGQDVGAVAQDSLRRRIGMVTQDASLLHRSVRENILYGADGAGEAEMVEAARRVAAHEFIPDLEDPQGRRGYDAQVGERGVKLSGGQRQRVALARVVLKNAPILVLDEATSALDSEVEAAIQDSLYGLMEGKTVIAIAHRLSTIARMDRIVVMEAGRIAETGSHAELLARGGLYAGFWARQSGGFIGVAAAE